jgi:hypothetical protein
MILELKIDELVLQGFLASDKDIIASAMQVELERLFAKEGVPASLQGKGSVAGINGGSIQVAPNSSPESVGIQVARALYGGMSE